MSKYTPEQLQSMAVIVLDDEQNYAGVRAMKLYMTVGMRIGLPPMQVRRRIIELAGGI